ncbi:hypothetical protein IMZ48_39570 [Candidatus Bathyarchaeota archaeon]|nr:hypothetical protein [Candidatus Bathyarchaeota archaeon]
MSEVFPFFSFVSWFVFGVREGGVKRQEFDFMSYDGWDWKGGLAWCFWNYLTVRGVYLQVGRAERISDERNMVSKRQQGEEEGWHYIKKMPLGAGNSMFARIASLV